MHRGIVIEQRQEHDNAFNDGGSQSAIESAPAVKVPAFDGFELVLPGGPAWSLRLPDLVRHVARSQKCFEASLIRVRHLIRIVGKPMGPRLLDAMCAEIALLDDQCVR